MDTEFHPDKKPDVCPNPNQAAAAAAKLEVTGEPIQTTIKMLIAKHVAVTSTLPVFEQFVPSRPDVPQKALDMLSDEAARHTRRIASASPRNSRVLAHNVSTRDGI